MPLAAEAAAAAAPPPGELVVPARQVADHHAFGLQAANETGYLREAGSHPSYAWFTYGETTGTPVPFGERGTTITGLRGDTLIHRPFGGSVYRYWNVRDGSRASVTVDDSANVLGLVGTELLVFNPDDDRLLLLSPDGQGRRERPVTGLPPGDASVWAAGFRRDGFYVTHRSLTTWKDTHFWVDATTLAARAVDTLPDPGIRQLGDWTAKRSERGARLDLWAAGTPTTEPPTRTYLTPGVHENTPVFLFGEELVGQDYESGDLHAFRPGNATPRKLLTGVKATVETEKDTAVVQTESPAGTTHTYSVGVDAAGKAAAATRLSTLPTATLPRLMPRMAMQNGQLTVIDGGPQQQATVSRYSVPAAGPLKAGSWQLLDGGEGDDPDSGDYLENCGRGAAAPGCEDLRGTGDGAVAAFNHEFRRLYRAGSDRSAHVPGPPYAAGSLQASGRYLAYGKTDPVDQATVLDLEQGKEIRTHAVRGGTFALSGSALWRETGTAGTVEAVNVRTGALLRTDKVAGCDIRQLDAYGSSLYWKCEKESGVHDLGTKTNVKLPAHGQARLGNGVVVLEAGGILKSVDLKGSTGTTGSTVTRELGRPAHPVADQGWTLDRQSGRVAYADAGQAVHIVPLGVTAPAMSAIDGDAATSADLSGKKTWAPRFWLSKSGGAWTLEVKRKATGTVVRTLTGTEAPGAVKPVWDGLDGSGWAVPNGDYTWTLTVKPADGQGAPLTRSGNLAVTGKAHWRDYIGKDTRSDIPFLDKDGKLGFVLSKGVGWYPNTTPQMVTGWDPAATFVPFGDLDNDRVNDRLVRDAKGVLHAQFAQPGRAVATRSKVIGPGWGQYDVLTSPGDLNGDGLADLIARQTATGDIYFYAQDGKGAFKARVLIQKNWKLYKTVVGAGDVNGDGIGEIFAVDGNGTVFRYDGDRTGTVRPRVRASADGWAKNRTAFTVMDIDGAGGKPAAIVTRNAAGELLHSPPPTGTALLDAGTRFADGYAGYKAIL
ncbi:FG-GAP-like repeat-containing protein [Streptomyces sp. NPDC002054]|uniref:FG-GAP-like repeat-containing protein n=1 Tax=Streptomyces sp. NPDC002054 TaxID=3154663 RepID=UPI003327C072